MLSQIFSLQNDFTRNPSSFSKNSSFPQGPSQMASASPRNLVCENKTAQLVLLFDNSSSLFSASAASRKISLMENFTFARRHVKAQRVRLMCDARCCCCLRMKLHSAVYWHWQISLSLSRRKKLDEQFVHRTIKHRKLNGQWRDYKDLACCQNMPMQSLNVLRTLIKFAWISEMTKRQVSWSFWLWLEGLAHPSIVPFTAWKLDLQLPFLHNELLDPRSTSVKISNALVDTSDGSNLHAQFEITSMDHFTKHFNLTFTRCELLKQLNISHSMLLPPNRSVMVNLSIPLPLYAEHKQETCQGIGIEI